MALESMVKVRLSGKEVCSPSTKQWAGAFLWCWKKRTDRRARSCGDVFGALARWAVAGCWLDAGGLRGSSGQDNVIAVAGTGRPAWSVRLEEVSLCHM